MNFWRATFTTEKYKPTLTTQFARRQQYKNVPQGSTLGPLLYTIYINNLQIIGLKGKYTVFADDTVVTNACQIQKELNDLINRDIVRYPS